MSNLIKRNDSQLVDDRLGYQADIYTKSLSENTRRAYLADIKEFFGIDNLSDLSIERIRSVNTATAQEYREVLLSKGRAESTINRKLTSLSAFYSFLCRHEIGIMSYNPFSPKEGVKRVKQNKRYSNTRCLTQKEVRSLVKVTMQETSDEGSRNQLESIRNRIIILLLATTGMRRAELVSIKLGQFKRTHGKDVIEIKGKGDKERMVVISTTIKVLIDNYIEMRGLTYQNRDRYLLASHTSNSDHFDKEGITPQTIYRVVKSVAEKAGVDAEDISPHSLRHTFVTEALDMGYRFEDVADMVGHADTSTTRRYDHSKRVVIDNPADRLSKMFLDD